MADADDVTKFWYENRSIGQTPNGLPMQNYVYDSKPTKTYFDDREAGQSVVAEDVDYYNTDYGNPPMYGGKYAGGGGRAQYGALDDVRWVQKVPYNLDLESLPSGGSVVPGFESGRKVGTGYATDDDVAVVGLNTDSRWMQTSPGKVERKMNVGGSVAPGFSGSRRVGYGAGSTVDWKKLLMIAGAAGIGLIVFSMIKKKLKFNANSSSGECPYCGQEMVDGYCSSCQYPDAYGAEQDSPSAGLFEDDNLEGDYHPWETESDVHYGARKSPRQKKSSKLEPKGDISEDDKRRPKISIEIEDDGEIEIERYGGAVKEFMMDYAEFKYPFDDKAQDELMRDIVSGRKKISMSQMKKEMKSEKYASKPELANLVRDIMLDNADGTMSETAMKSTLERWGFKVSDWKKVFGRLNKGGQIKRQGKKLVWNYNPKTGDFRWAFKYGGGFSNEDAELKSEEERKARESKLYCEICEKHIDDEYEHMVEEHNDELNTREDYIEFSEQNITEDPEDYSAGRKPWKIRTMPKPEDVEGAGFSIGEEEDDDDDDDVAVSIEEDEEEEYSANSVDMDSAFWEAGESKNFKGKYDKKQMDMGRKVEMEHTTDTSISEKISRDHLAEIPDYYDRLDAMESEAELGKSRYGSPKRKPLRYKYDHDKMMRFIKSQKKLDKEFSRYEDMGYGYPEITRMIFSTYISGDMARKYNSFTGKSRNADAFKLKKDWKKIL